MTKENLIIALARANIKCKILDLQGGCLGIIHERNKAVKIHNRVSQFGFKIIELYEYKHTYNNIPEVNTIIF